MSRIHERKLLLRSVYHLEKNMNNLLLTVLKVLHICTFSNHAELH